MEVPGPIQDIYQKFNTPKPGNTTCVSISSLLERVLYDNGTHSRGVRLGDQVVPVWNRDDLIYQTHPGTHSIFFNMPLVWGKAGHRVYQDGTENHFALADYFLPQALDIETPIGLTPRAGLVHVVKDATKVIKYGNTQQINDLHHLIPVLQMPGGHFTKTSIFFWRPKECNAVLTYYTTEPIQAITSGAYNSDRVHTYNYFETRDYRFVTTFARQGIEDTVDSLVLGPRTGLENDVALELYNLLQTKLGRPERRLARMEKLHLKYLRSLDSLGRGPNQGATSEK